MILSLVGLAATASAGIYASTAATHYRGNPINVSVSATAESWWAYTAGDYDSHGSYYSWGRLSGIHSFALSSVQVEVSGGPSNASATVTYPHTLSAGTQSLWAAVNVGTWRDGHWQSNGYYDEEGNWVDEEESWNQPEAGLEGVEGRNVTFTVSNGGSTPQTITWSNPPPSLWSWNVPGPVLMGATCTSGNAVKYSLGATTGYPGEFSVDGNAISCSGIVHPSWIGGNTWWSVVAEAPASATHAYTIATHYITLDRGRYPTMPTPIAGPTISKDGAQSLWGLVLAAATQAGLSAPVLPEFQLQSGGGQIVGGSSYWGMGYIGNVTVRARYPESALMYPSNDGYITFATAIPTVAPSFQTQPTGATLLVGANISLTVAANGYPEPTYQWRKNGVNIAGATSPTLTFNNVQVADSGNYVAVATNSAGTAQSNVATLSVSVPPPTITTQPISRTTYAGEAVAFSVVAAGAPAPAYQWRRNGVPVGGATGANLIMSNPQIADAGSYSVVVSNIHGSVTSANVTLTVNPARPPIITPPSG